MYFREVNVTGAWADIRHSGGFQFHADDASDKSETKKLTLGKVGLKIVRGCTASGIHYLNVHAQHLSSVGVSVGGLLGEDDHAAEEMPSEECGHRASLAIMGRDNARDGSIAAATLE